MSAHFVGLSTSVDSPSSIGVLPSRTRRVYNTIFKRWLDIALVLVALPVVLPVVAILALLVALDGNNPFYSQMRIGQHGKKFRIWKIRTMVPDAEIVLKKHLDTNSGARAEWNKMQKLRNDPRITRVGRVLRKTSLDELPQLLNVLLGTMSLVGPRPMMPDQQNLYPGLAYYDLRPGLTGLWQISERNNTAFASRAGFDDRYASNMSMYKDLQIMLRTVGVVMKATGQ